MTRTATHKELDEIKAPFDVEEVGVAAGERGVVVEIFERPERAVMVEFADEEGRTKALIVYSPDLSRHLEVIPEPA